MSNRGLKELREIVSKDPADLAFYELSKELVKDSPEDPNYDEPRLIEAREVLLRGISANPLHSKARLLLSKIYYLQRLPEFSLRELVELYRVSRNPLVKDLMASFGQVGEEFLHAYKTIMEGKIQRPKAPPGSSQVFAEVDIGGGFDGTLDSLED